MNDEPALFRPEAVAYKKTAWLGDFTVSAPSLLPVALWCALGVLLLTLLLLFTPYAQRVSVEGRVIYRPAAAEAVFNQDGIIDRIQVHQGEKVNKGDIIATYSRDIAYAGGGMNQALQDAAQHQLNELQKREAERHREGNEERQRLGNNISAKQREIAAIQAAVIAEQARSASVKKRMTFYQELRQKGVTTVQENIERENEYHNAVAQLNLHRINLARAQGELLQLQDEREKSEAQEKQSISEMQQQQVVLQQQVITASALVASHIVAPLEGVITSLGIVEGQRVAAGVIAAVVVPVNAQPLVEMWLPAAALQDVNAGQHVVMRVASLPWQRFGKVSGTVTAISASPDALSGEHRRFRLLIVPRADTRDLPAGVAVEADILTTHRRIWEWLFSPMNTRIQRTTVES